MPLSFDHFWCDVFLCANKRGCPDLSHCSLRVDSCDFFVLPYITGGDHFERCRVGGPFGQIKVGEHDVARGMQQNVLGFEISINKPHEVDVLQRKNHLGDVKFGCFFVHSMVRLVLETPEELPPCTILHYKVKMVT
eukprot:Lithocolla_globosa_v1_NODE_3211_length_1732_cov_13.491950.p2 type:complete len:136 gc:universal NODE_3211_length_1732_cov_13.491950:1206-799(-)